MALLQKREDFFAEELHNAFKYSNDDTMAMLLTSVSPCAVKEIGSAYYKKYKKSIIDDAKAGSMAYFEDYIVELIKGNREPEGRVDPNRVREDVERLSKSGISTWFNKEGVFIDIFTHRSYSHIRQVQEEYDRMNPGQSLKKAIRKKAGNGGLGQGLLAMLKNIENQPEYFANEIEGAATPLVGPNTRDNKKLIRILRGRCGIDLGDIRDAYPRNHDNKPLEQMIKDRTYGDYEKALIAMLKE